VYRAASVVLARAGPDSPTSRRIEGWILIVASAASDPGTTAGDGLPALASAARSASVVSS